MSSIFEDIYLIMNTSFSGAINKAFFDSMKEDKKVICMGLGVTDPKGVFGTTVNLEKYFGPERVMDTPTSENSVTGICAGLAMAGLTDINSPATRLASFHSIRLLIIYQKQDICLEGKFLVLLL